MAWAGTSGLNQVATFRGAKGWQIESFPGIVIHMIDPKSSRVEQGAWRTAVGVPGWSKVLMGLAVATVLVVAWRWAARVGIAGRDLAVDAYAPIAVSSPCSCSRRSCRRSTCCGSCRSPPSPPPPGDRTVGVLTLAITALTTFILASIHAQTEGALWATIPILVRNTLLVALAVVVLVRLRRLAAPAGTGPRRSVATASPSA